jgi:hypothetical protein
MMTSSAKPSSAHQETLSVLFCHVRTSHISRRWFSESPRNPWRPGTAELDTLPLSTGRRRVAGTTTKGMETSSSQESESASDQIDARIRELDDWRGEMLSRLRALIKQADPDVVEEWKWKKATNPGVPVWSHDGIICTGETYKSVVKMTFAKGASLEDPSGLFNSSLEGNVRRAIDFHEGDRIDEKALEALIRSAVALNTSR